LASSQGSRAESGRWARETEFFDHEEYSSTPVPQISIERYLNLREPWPPAEAPYAFLGDLRGKRVLEVGCGDGTNAVLMALRGAQVVGLDLSSRALDAATQKAAAHGISERVRFERKPVEVFAEESGEQFDVICGWAVLHHLIPVLDEFIMNVKRLGRPNTVYVFIEPVSLSQWFRKLRLALPIPLHATPDERPLEPAEIEILERQIPGMQRFHYGLLERLAVRLIPKGYENETGWRRKAYEKACLWDRALLRLDAFKPFASGMVVHNRQRAG